MEIRLAEDKLVKLKDKLAYIANRKKVTLGELLSLIGFLKFACAVVTLGRAYLMKKKPSSATSFERSKIRH